MTRKPLIIAAILSAGLIPLSSFAWHGGPHWDDQPGPGWHHRYDGPHCGYWQDGPRVGPRHKAMPPRAFMHREVHTFGMDREQAGVFMDEVQAIFGVTAQQKNAWQQMKQAYTDMAQVRCDHRAAFKPGMTHQQRLEARSAFMKEHARTFDAYVQARAQLQKVMTEEQMAQFDHIVRTGSLIKPPAAPQVPPPKPPKAPKA